MDMVLTIVIYTFLAGLCIPLGGLIAIREDLRPHWLKNELRHFIIAFAGGILVAAVALILVPEGTHYVNNSFFTILFFLLGGIVFFLIERQMGVKRREKPQLLAMLLDYVPESLALGGAFALGSVSAPLLALFIGLQNLPEGFNSYRELKQNGLSGKKILGFMVLLTLIGPIVGLIGYFYLAQNEFLLGGVILFASGGILYLIFQDIAPQSKMQNHWAPPLGAVMGFCFGMFGNSFIV